MTDRNYRINPDFVVREPRAASFFAFIPEEGYDVAAANKIFDGWKEQGAKQLRITLVNDEYPNPPYPHGFWLEGWPDGRDRMLPFGEAEGPDKGCSPPLTAATGNAETPKPSRGTDHG